MARFIMIDGTVYDTDKATLIAEHQNSKLYMTASRHFFAVDTSGSEADIQLVYASELPTPEQTKRSEIQYQYDSLKAWFCRANRPDLLKAYFDIDLKDA